MKNTYYLDFDRDDWAGLRGRTPLTLTEEEVEKLSGLNVNLDIDMVEETFLPLSRLLNLYVQGSQLLASVTDTFLGTQPQPKPFVIGVAGSVAVGKSTIARVLDALLARWPHHPRVDLVTTDGFLYPNRILDERGLMDRKGFPESYNRSALLEFVAAAAAGEEHLEIPVYSHIRYDIVDGETRVINQPNILIVEGLNVLQAGETGAFVSDYFDFSIFVDADPADIEHWYVERFLTLKETAFTQPDAYFRRYVELSRSEAIEVARKIWTEINLVNLTENILPTRDRASLILEKGRDHSVKKVRLRR
ncbi:MAG TPA: type I pantothenate kinase [Acidimicrobiia bacterium]|nr:type I pantothenate kinase [Acidimicrobiia bacterium]